MNKSIGEHKFNGDNNMYSLEERKWKEELQENKAQPTSLLVFILRPAQPTH
jgi:hypothetical protein